MFRHLSRPHYASPDEERFCRERLAFRQQQIIYFGYLLTLVMQSLGIAVALIFIEDPIRSVTLSFHALSLTAAVVGLVYRQHPRVFRGGMTCLYYMTGLGSVGVLHLASSVWHAQGLAVPSLLVIVGMGIMSPPMFPGTHLHMALFLMGLTALVHLVRQGEPQVWGTTGAVAILLSYGFLLRVLLFWFLEHTAQAIYRFRVQVVPEHIVRRSADETSDVSDLFRPKSQFCVCISSDWRNYQKLSAGMEPAALTAALDEYYALAHGILRRLVPDGRYFTDWIADELFVVVYGGSEMSEKQLVNTAVRFGLELLAAKVAFQKAHGIPEAIDVGIAAGSALIGLMGPEGHRKATAIGEIPGRARRMQSAGKLVRHHMGEADRVIFGSESLLRITEGFAITPFPLPSGKFARDLQDREIYVVERDAAEDGDSSAA